MTKSLPLWGRWPSEARSDEVLSDHIPRLIHNKGA